MDDKVFVVIIRCHQSANRCQALVAAQGLVMAGIDLRRTPEG